jgi:uncharacterized membrane protein
MSEQATGMMDAKAAGSCNLVYILYLVALIVGITALIGLVIAYLNRNEAPAAIQTHYQFQIRTFWIGLLFGVIGALTSVIIIGWFILLATVIWWIVRCVKGMQYLGRRQAYPNPTTWMI